MAEKRDSYCVIHDTHPLGIDPCFACIEDFKASNRGKSRLDRSTLIEASYRIASEMFKKLGVRHSVDFNRGFVKASTVSHDVIKKMIDEAK